MKLKLYLCIAMLISMTFTSIFGQERGYVILKDSTYLQGYIHINSEEQSFKFTRKAVRDTIFISPENVLSFGYNQNDEISKKKIPSGEEVYVVSIEKGNYQLFKELFAEDIYYLQQPNGSFSKVPIDKKERKELLRSLLAPKNNSKLLSSSIKGFRRVIRYLNSPTIKKLPKTNYGIQVGGSFQSLNFVNTFSVKYNGFNENDYRNTGDSPYFNLQNPYSAFNYEIGMVGEFPLKILSPISIQIYLGVDQINFEHREVENSSLIREFNITGNYLNARGSIKYSFLKSEKLYPYIHAGWGFGYEIFDQSNALRIEKDGDYQLFFNEHDSMDDLRQSYFIGIGGEWPISSVLILKGEIGYDYLTGFQLHFNKIQSFSIRFSINI